MSGELTEFEKKSSLIPKTVPYAILGGAGLALILFILIGQFAKNEAVTDITDKDEAAATTQGAQPQAAGEEIEL